MKQKNLEANIFFTIIFAFVILFIMINSVFMGINYTKEDEAIKIGIECYGSHGSQCALHNIFEEGDFEDQNIETAISWLEMIFNNYYLFQIPPHLITMIGRFYESELENK